MTRKKLPFVEEAVSHCRSGIPTRGSKQDRTSQHRLRHCCFRRASLLGPSILVLAIAILASGCSNKSETTPTPPRPIYTHIVSAPSATIRRIFSGQLAASEGANIAFEVTGRIIEVIAKEGAKYQRGDILAKLDDAEYQSSLADETGRHIQTQQELRRVQRLFESGNASQSQLDSAIAQESSARSTLEVASKRVNDCILTMPYDGVIGSVDVRAQQVVSAGSTVMTIQGDGGMEFEIGVPADLLAGIDTGMEASIVLLSFPNDPLSATVTEVAPQVGSNSTYPVTLTVSDSNDQARAGMDGEATLLLANPNGPTITVPVTCINASGETPHVWIVDNLDNGTAKVSRQPVELGKLRESGTIEIVNGIIAGDVLVSRGVNRLEEGMTVGYTPGIP